MLKKMTIEDLAEKMDTMNSNLIKKIDTDIENLAIMVAGGFRFVDNRIDSLEQKYDKQFEKIDLRFDSVDHRLDDLYEKFMDQDLRLSRMDGLLADHELRIVSLEK